MTDDFRMDGFTSGSCFAAIRHPEPAVPKLNQVQSFNLEPRGTQREQKLELQERQRNREKSKNEKKNENKNKNVNMQEYNMRLLLLLLLLLQ